MLVCIENGAKYTACLSYFLMMFVLSSFINLCQSDWLFESFACNMFSFEDYMDFYLMWF